MSLLKEDLKKIFSENINKKICVLGTTCTGKTTLINELNVGKDMDDLIFPLLTESEKNYVCQSPWTQEIGNKMDEFVRTKLSIKPSVPLFGTVLLPCDLIVYLRIDDELLLERTNLRHVNFLDAKNMQSKIEKEIYDSNIETIIVDVSENLKKKNL